MKKVHSKRYGGQGPQGGGALQKNWSVPPDKKFREIQQERVPESIRR